MRTCSLSCARKASGVSVRRTVAVQTAVAPGSGGAACARPSTVRLTSRAPCRLRLATCAVSRAQDSSTSQSGAAAPVHGGHGRPSTRAAQAIAGLSSLPELWAWAAQQYGDAPALEDRHRSPMTVLTYAQLHEAILHFAAGLNALGVRPGERVALFAESSGRWQVADAGIMTAGAVDAVRGVDSISTDELRFIADCSQATAVVAQDAHTLERLLPELPDSCALAVVLWGAVPSLAEGRAHSHLKVVSFEQLMDTGRQALPGWEPPRASRHDLASLAFTSGTSGKPKGVMTSHHNFLSQLVGLDMLPVEPGDVAVSYLPPWHAYGRTLDYYLFSRGVKLHYSRLRDLKQDLVEQQPHIFVSVPLLLDNLHSKAMQQLHKVAGQAEFLDAALHHIRALRVVNGMDLAYAVHPPNADQRAGAAAVAALLAPMHLIAEQTVFKDLRHQLGFSRARWVVSGGGSLVPQIDDFYEAIGVPVIVGYGLTETSPVLTIRHLDDNVRGTIGPPIPDTGIRIAAPHNKAEELPDGQQGLIMATGPQVMSGYWENPDATAKAFPALGSVAGDADGGDAGWFDTGDLGWRVPHGVPGSRMGGHIVITGREKDTIVLLSGENVEPQPLEDLLCASPHIEFAVLLGSGRRGVGALLVPSQQAVDQAGGDARSPAMHKLMQEEVAEALSARATHERVRAFAVLSEGFSIEEGTLTRTMKPRKAAIFAKCAEQVAEVEKELR